MRFGFPPGFVWGAATAAHQVEGNNSASDFWLLEHTPGTVFRVPRLCTAGFLNPMRSADALCGVKLWNTTGPAVVNRALYGIE